MLSTINRAKFDFQKVGAYHHQIHHTKLCKSLSLRIHKTNHNTIHKKHKQHKQKNKHTHPHTTTQPICTPSHNVRETQFLCLFVSLRTVSTFLLCHSGGCEVVLICTFLMTKGVVSLVIDHMDMVFCDMPVLYIYIYVNF